MAISKKDSNADLVKKIAALEKEVAALKKELRAKPSGGADPRVDQLISFINVWCQKSSIQKEKGSFKSLAMVWMLLIT